MTLLDVLFDFFRRAARPRSGGRSVHRPAKPGKAGARAHSGERGADAIYRVEGISENARKVYVHLSATVDADGCCPAFHRMIAKGAGLSRPTVAKAIRELEARGFVTHRQRIGRRGENVNLYHLERLPER